MTAALKVIGIGTEKVVRTATIDDTNFYLLQGNDEHWDTYNQNSFNRQEKYKWLDDTYKNLADGAKSEIIETENTIESAYIDSITKFDVIEPYDGVNFQFLNE